MNWYISAVTSCPIPSKFSWAKRLTKDDGGEDTRAGACSLARAGWWLILTALIARKLSPSICREVNCPFVWHLQSQSQLWSSGDPSGVQYAVWWVSWMIHWLRVTWAGWIWPLKVARWWWLPEGSWETYKKPRLGGVAQNNPLMLKLDKKWSIERVGELIVWCVKGNQSS